MYVFNSFSEESRLCFCTAMSVPQWPKGLTTKYVSSQASLQLQAQSNNKREMKGDAKPG
jgi:hypothetical protein